MRAQISSEFMVVYSALLLIFVIVFTIYFGGSLNLFQGLDSVAALRDAQATASAINFVYLAGDGASYSFTPSHLADNENITLTAFGVTSERLHGYASAPLIIGKVNASTLGRMSMVITDNRGEIYIQ